VSPSCPVPTQLPTGRNTSHSCLSTGLFSSHLMQNRILWVAEYFLTRYRVVQLKLFRDLEGALEPHRQQEMSGQWLLLQERKIVSLHCIENAVAGRKDGRIRP
jgi:hypothetical protein